MALVDGEEHLPNNGADIAVMTAHRMPWQAFCCFRKHLNKD